jgi:hypothetical protein
MPKVIFGLANKNIDPAEYHDGIAASVRDCYRVQVGQDEHFSKRLGLTALASIGSDATQGRYETFGGVVLEVIGGNVYELSSAGALTIYAGGALTKNTPCVFTEDFGHVFIAHGGEVARVDTSAKTVELVTTGPANVTHITFSKGYLLCNGLLPGGIEGDTNYSDDVSNGYTSWEVFNNERLPDGCNAVVSGWDAEVYSFGPNSVEVSYNDGSTPWAVLQGAYLQYGCLAPYTVTIADNTLFWLSESDGARRIVKMVERAPQIISGPFDRMLNDMATVSDAVAWTQQQRGFSFYVISFPSEDITLAYKLDDGTWAEWGYYNPETASYERYRGGNARYIRAWNKTLVGDRSTGIVYEQSGTSDNGEAIRMEITTGQMESGAFKTKKEKGLLFRVKRGYGDGGTFQYRVRDDNGQWRNEKSLSLGVLGNTKPYIKTPSGGVFRSRQYQVVHSDIETDFIFMGMENEIEGTGR